MVEKSVFEYDGDGFDMKDNPKKKNNSDDFFEDTAKKSLVVAGSAVLLVAGISLLEDIF